PRNDDFNGASQESPPLLPDDLPSGPWPDAVRCKFTKREPQDRLRPETRGKPGRSRQKRLVSIATAPAIGCTHGGLGRVFTLSLDDLVTASFVSGPSATTLPMAVFSRVRLEIRLKSMRRRACSSPSCSYWWRSPPS